MYVYPVTAFYRVRDTVWFPDIIQQQFFGLMSQIFSDNTDTNILKSDWHEKFSELTWFQENEYLLHHTRGQMHRTVYIHN